MGKGENPLLGGEGERFGDAYAECGIDTGEANKDAQSPGWPMRKNRPGSAGGINPLKRLRSAGDGAFVSCVAAGDAGAMKKGTPRGGADGA